LTFEGLGFGLKGGFFGLQFGLNLGRDLLQARLHVLADRRAGDRAFQRDHANAGKRRAMTDRRGGGRSRGLGEGRRRH